MTVAYWVLFTWVCAATPLPLTGRCVSREVTTEAWFRTPEACNRALATITALRATYVPNLFGACIEGAYDPEE